MNFTELIERLRKLEKAATPGPWGNETDKNPGGYRNVITGQVSQIVARTATSQSSEIPCNNGRLIVETRNALPGILDELEILKEENYDLRIRPDEEIRAMVAEAKLAEAKEVLEFYAQWEDSKGAFDQTYDRTTLNFNYPGQPKARALLEKWK
jgi:hypothetical protein